MPPQEACYSPCPPQCASVFDRVVISHLIAGPSRILFELLPTFTDPGPLTAQLQAGTTANPLADDWTDVGLPVTDQYVLYDPEQRVWGKTNWTHYRIVLTTPLGVYYSLPTGGLGTLDRRSWRIAREFARQRVKHYQYGPEGQWGYLLKRRWTGIPCKVCLDYQTMEVRDPNCATCYGTGFECGYFYPQSCVWAAMSPRASRISIEGGGQRGLIEDIVVQADMVLIDLVSEDDVFVNGNTDDRYYVHRVTNKVEIRGIPVAANVEMRPIAFSSQIYTIDIPDQLTNSISV